MSDDSRVRIFDTTLRDGQQCPGAGMSFEKNLEYAHLAADVGVDILEAGFPSASKVDFDIVHTIATELPAREHSPVIAGLCQLRRAQVEKTIEALAPAVARRKAKLHVYLPVDPGLMSASLGDEAEDKSGFVKKVFEYCKLAVDAGLAVEFSPEGYSRQGENFDFVTDLIRAAVEAGADTINCPDTIGGGYRLQGEEYFVHKMTQHAKLIAAEFPDKDIIWSTHCHNDFGLAVENSITAVVEGPARQIEGCFNGIGERAGNASLEQCILIIKHFGEKLSPPLHTTIRTEHIQAVSDFVHRHMLPRQPHSPISGDNAARHSSGGHTNAVLSDPLAYQPFDPKETGKEISLAFGPLSGGNHARSIIEAAGYLCKDDEKAKIAQYIKDTYPLRRKGITDEELIKAYLKYRSPICVDEIDYERNQNVSRIVLEGEFFGQTGTINHSYEGKDSALTTLKAAIDGHYPGLVVEHYSCESVGSGVNATSRSRIVISRADGVLFEGVDSDHDISRSAMHALVKAVNKAYIDQHYKLKKKLETATETL